MRIRACRCADPCVRAERREFITRSFGPDFCQGRRAHNLKNVDVTIPRDKFVGADRASAGPASRHWRSTRSTRKGSAVTSSRCLPTRGSFSARWISRTWTPSKDLSPAISIDQKTTSRNPASTVGTVTEIYDYLRLLFARVGEPHCPECGIPITSQTVEQMVDRILEYPEGTRLQVLAPDRARTKGRTYKAAGGYSQKRLRPGSSQTANCASDRADRTGEKQKAHD